MTKMISVVRKRSAVFLLFFCLSMAATAQENKELNVYRGSTPALDGIISSGEYDDATFFAGTTDWAHYCGKVPAKTDLGVKAWVKHDGQNLYFAFDVTDDVIYGIDIPRWTPDQNPDVHQFDPPNGWPWFGDGIEIFLDPGNNTDIAKITGDAAWIVACSTHKSYLNGLGKGGLIDGEPKNSFSWDIYRQWIKSGAMKAVVRIKSGKEKPGYVIEWKIASNPCLKLTEEIGASGSGTTKMGINFEFQDLDEKEKGKGNFANMHHIEVWNAKKREHDYLRTWGTLILHPTAKPDGCNESHVP